MRTISMKPYLLAIVLICSGALADAQPLPIDKLTPALPTAAERRVADAASWVTVLAGVALDTKASVDAPDRRRAFALQGARVGVTYGAVFLAKTLVHRHRPCAPDCGIDNPDFSFYSAHTALAFSTIGGPRLAIALPLAVSTGGLRVAAGKHWLTDVATGAAAGWLTSKLR
jgi:membrane-associated phospholipid phosphatase